MTAQPQRIGFLLWPATRALTLSLAEEALRAARRLHPEALYEPLFLLAEAPAEEEGWRLPGTAWNGRLEQCSRLFLVADEAPALLFGRRFGEQEQRLVERLGVQPPGRPQGFLGKR